MLPNTQSSYSYYIRPKLFTYPFKCDSDFKFFQIINKKISILLSIKWTLSVLKLMVLYSTLIRTAVTALCNNKEGRCWRPKALIVKHEADIARAVPINPCSWKDDCKIECRSDSSKYNATEQAEKLHAVRAFFKNSSN